MRKTNLFILILSIFLMVAFVGCNSQANNSEPDSAVDKYDYYDLGNDLKLQLKANNLENDLFSFELNLESDSQIYAEFTASVDDASNCYLMHNSGKDKIEAFGGVSTNVLFFDEVKYDLSEYTLHIECPISVSLKDEYPISIFIKDDENLYDDSIIELPFGNFIKADKSNIRYDFDYLSDKCTDITFSTSSDSIDFDIRVNKSEISTGAPVGDFSQVEKNKYIYSHPINENETEIIIAFNNISLNDVCECDIEL